VLTQALLYSLCLKLQPLQPHQRRRQ
jgi:hypothetical protein